MNPANWRCALVAGLTAGMLGLPARSTAQSAENVLLVINEMSPASVEIGAYYARRRGVPAANVVRLSTLSGDEITRADFDRQIQAPIATWLGRQAAYDRILYLVLCKGVPLRIAGSSGRNGSVASVDSELALLYRRLTGRAIAPEGRVENPYFLGESDLAQAKPFTHETADIYLVTRLDGFTVEDVMGLIDRGLAPVTDGLIALDQKAAVQEVGNRWLETAAEALRENLPADRVVLESTSKVVRDEFNVLGYYSWGSSDPAQIDRGARLGFVPGAIAATFVSTDARTFTEPPQTWKLGTWGNPASYYAGSPQSLTGDLIRGGVTAVAGHVAEPYLDGTIRPQILFPAYLAGFSIAESFYLALPYLSWQTVIVGDPLCAPFRRSAVSQAGTDQRVDPETELPTLFSTRRLESLAGKGISTDALKRLMRGQARLVKGDTVGARQAFEEATNLDDRLTQGHFYLAALFEQAGEYDQAIERYRRILRITPNDVPALNNLAYALAERKQVPADALPFAEKAYALDRGNPAVADTLGWCHHLLGTQREAARLLAEAVKGAPQSAEIRVHAARTYAALGQIDLASQELTKALELAPVLATRQDVSDLRLKLQAARQP